MSVIFIHFDGMWMIGQGTNGISRGIFYEGVMNGKPIFSFLPLRESALERLDPLGRWIEQWDYELGRSVKTLDTELWFIRRNYHD